MLIYRERSDAQRNLTPFLELKQKFMLRNKLFEVN